ncbi:MAG: hypothetical protein CM15mP74_28920 [Halieaceae bacterium]|nr:MAG: hypothetical protein CM15mP74_28920 [Halieaceae bacterium]
MLCEGLGRPFRSTSIPPEMFDWIRWVISPLALVSQRFRDRMEFLRIAKFYATESMLHWDETPSGTTLMPRLSSVRTRWLIFMQSWLQEHFRPRAWRAQPVLRAGRRFTPRAP